MPSVSIVGAGKNRSGFQPLPSDSEPPVLTAARKSRAEKNKKAVKIAVGVLLVSAVLAGLTAFLLTRSTIPTTPLSSIPQARNIMVDKLVHTEQVRAVANSNDLFATKMYGQLAKEDGNLVMSPFSVSGVMAMLSAGAQEATLAEIQTGMNFPDQDSLKLGYSDTFPALRTNENFTLESANTIFTQTGFPILQSYQDILHKYFHAGIQATDFSKAEAAARLINDWVKDITRDKIKDLIKSDSLGSLTRLVLVNAIYFKGDWADKFDPKMTLPSADFHITQDQTVQVPMMRREGKYSWADMDGYKMIELPYKGDRVTMQVLLPDRSVSLAATEEKLKFEDIESQFRSRQNKEKVMLKMPKFKVEKTIPLTEQLSNLGMSEMFGGNSDFSGIDGSHNLYVSEVMQKAFIEVNEEGAEAAAATGAVLMMRSMPMPPMEFTVDRPFLFLVRDNLTGMLLFQGRVNNPSD